MVVNDQFKPEAFSFDIGDDAVALEWNPKFKPQFPEAVKAVNQAEEDLLAGKVEAPSAEVQK
jgi:hypothetical protein